MPPIRRHDINARDNKRNAKAAENPNGIPSTAAATAGLAAANATSTTTANANNITVTNGLAGGAGTAGATPADPESVRNMRKHAGTPGSAELQATRDVRRHKRVKRAQTPGTNANGQQGRATRGRITSARRGTSLHSTSVAAGGGNSDGYPAGKSSRDNLRPHDRETGGINGPTPSRPKPRRLNSVISGGRQLPAAPPTANPSQVVMNGPLANPVAGSQRHNQRHQYALGIAPPVDLPSNEYVKPPLIGGARDDRRHEGGSSNENHHKSFSPEVSTYPMNSNSILPTTDSRQSSKGPRRSGYHQGNIRGIATTVNESNNVAIDASRLSRYAEENIVSKRPYMSGSVEPPSGVSGTVVNGEISQTNFQAADLINKIVQSLLPSIQAIVETTINNTTSSVTGLSNAVPNRINTGIVTDIPMNDMTTSLHQSTKSNLSIPNNDHNVGLRSSPRKLLDAANIPTTSADVGPSTDNGVNDGTINAKNHADNMDQRVYSNNQPDSTNLAVQDPCGTTLPKGLCQYTKSLNPKLMQFHAEFQDLVVRTQNKLGDDPLDPWMAWLYPYLIRQFNFNSNSCNIIIDRPASDILKQWLNYHPRMTMLSVTMSVIPIFFRRMHQVAGAYQCGGGDVDRNKKEWIGFFRLLRGILRYFVQRLANRCLIYQRIRVGILPPQIETQIIQEQRIMMLKERKKLIKDLDSWRESYVPLKKKLDKTLSEMKLGLSLTDLDEWESTVLIKPPSNNEVFVGGVAEMCTAKEVEDYCFQQEDMFHEREFSFRKYLRTFNDHHEMCSDKLKWSLSVWNIDEEIRRDRIVANSGTANVGDGISTRCSIDSDYRVVQRLQGKRRSLSRVILDIR